MKTTFIYTLAAGVIIFSFAACNKEQENPETQSPEEMIPALVTESLSAQKESDATKVTMNSSRQFGWCGSDIAAFSIYDGAKYDFVNSDGYGETAANKFTVTYSGTRQGYAVIPSTFAKSLSADGNTLKVTYPTSYDIATAVDGGIYDNADGNHFIPFPMVAVSNAATDEGKIKFYSIGAMVRVVMNHIPAGTKNLYITFNQTVTGDFTVNMTEPTEPVVAVSDTDYPSTVTIHISEAGLTAERNITLYIPVPTAAGLRIASSATTMTTVARNMGYSWTVDAITNIGDGSFATTTGTFIIAPGNLLAYMNPSTHAIEYSFLDGMNQLKSTRGAGPSANDRHNNAYNSEKPVANLAELEDGKYQDVFTWSQLGGIVGNTGDWQPNISYFDPADKIFHFPVNTITIKGNAWKVPDENIMLALCNLRGRGYVDTPSNPHYSIDPIYHRTGLACARNKANTIAKVLVDVSGTDYASHAMWKGATNDITTVGGFLLFPDGYADQTDVLLNRVGYSSACENDSDWGTTDSSLEAYRNNILISYSSFVKMLANGAIFLPAVGLYAGGWVFEGAGNNTISGYYLSDAAYKNGSSVNYYGLNVSNLGPSYKSRRTASYYCSVRLVREK